MSAYAVRVQTLPAIPVAVVRHTARAAELPKLVPHFCGVVWKEIRAQEAKGGRHVAIYWNSEIRLEVGVELQGPFVETDTIVKSATPAGEVASVTHFGPYNTMDAARDAIRNWCRANHRFFAGPSWEIYGHWDQSWNDNPSLIRTDIFYQLAPAGT